MIPTSLFDTIRRAAGESDRIHGVVVGVVTNNQDPDGLGRVKVRLPWLSEEHESNWARMMTPMAGNDRGFYMLPEVDDEVLVAFEHGHVEHPYVLGAFLSLVPAQWSWALAGLGAYQLDANLTAIAAGGHVRVGLEDNAWFDRARTRHATNVDLVRRVAEAAALAERPLATPGEVRRMLALAPVAA